MRRLACASVALALASSAHVAHADQAPLPPRFELGGRVGFGVPLGSASATADLNTFISNMVPLWLDAGVAINDNWYVGAYFQYGVGSIPSMFASACGTSGVSCKIFDGRVGGDVELRTHSGRDQFWGGLGIGYEWYGLDASAGGQTASLRLSGWEFMNVEAGYDYLTRSGGVGPFVALTVGQFKDLSTSGTGMDVSQSIPSQALHEWLVFGVRGFLDIPFTPRGHAAPEPQMEEPPAREPEIRDPDAEDPKPSAADPRHPDPHRGDSHDLARPDPHEGW